ncbi:MAG: galactose-1-phosphate uridylyltransferase, partial [Acidimicrobiia bacterium]
MPELRDDSLTGARVIVAPGRSARPDAFRVQAPASPAAVASCPFCAGNEHETPPEVARTGSGQPETPGWRVRVVPNKYPIVGEGLAGAHEVVIFSPAHNRSFADLDPDAAR